MSLRKWTSRVHDILDAVAEIQEFTQGVDFDSFKNDIKTIRQSNWISLSLVKRPTRFPIKFRKAIPKFDGI